MARTRRFKQRSVMPPQQRFSMIPSVSMPRSRFDRSHGYKTTMDGGQLVPFYVDEVLPGDTFHMNATAFTRLATPLHPFMDNLHLDTFFFFVPNRLVWDNWEDFITGQEDLTVPLIEDEGITFLSRPDYMGIRPQDNVGFNALPFRAYNLIWNEWFRDQNMQEEVTVDTGDGPDGVVDYLDLLPRGKRHDYFTSALPWPQKGEAVEISLGDVAPVVADGQFRLENAEGYSAGFGVAGTNWERVDPAGTPGANQDFSYLSGLEADLSGATAITINSMREAITVQQMLERDARGGTRYTEVLLAHFGVHSPDARLQRPEYLGGSTDSLRVDPIASTVAETNAPQANLAGVGTAVGRARWNKSFVEHGYIIGLVALRADLTYQQGMERHFMRRTRYDFYWKTFAHLGEQAVYQNEIFYEGGSPSDEDFFDVVFGYQERYAEYRYKPSLVTGQFRSDHPQSLDTWHLAQDFSSAPQLNAEFIEDDPPIERVIAVPSEPHLLLDAYFDLKCTRPMPTYGVPGLRRL